MVALLPLSPLLSSSSWCNQMVDPWSQMPLPMDATTWRSRRPGVVRRSQAGGLASSIVATFVLAFLRQTCLTYVCTQILLLPLTHLWSSTCIRALEAPGLYYDACMTYLCCRVVLWYLPVSPWSWSYTFACMISVRSNRGRHRGFIFFEVIWTP